MVRASGLEYFITSVVISVTVPHSMHANLSEMLKCMKTLDSLADKLTLWLWVVLFALCTSLIANALGRH